MLPFLVSIRKRRTFITFEQFEHFALTNISLLRNMEHIVRNFNKLCKPHHTTPPHTTSHHITPHHTIPHHTTPHQTTPHQSVTEVLVLRSLLRPYQRRWKANHDHDQGLVRVELAFFKKEEEGGPTRTRTMTTVTVEVWGRLLTSGRRRWSNHNHDHDHGHGRGLGPPS